MEGNGEERVRVILRWIQIKDKLEPFFKEHGEFFFRTRISTAGNVVEHRLPEEGHWEISDHPRFNKVDKIDKVLYEGPAGDSLVVEMFGEEIDQFSANDHLDEYKREFTGSPETWVGLQAPGDEGSTDPENLSNWRIGYEIELI